MMSFGREVQKARIDKGWKQKDLRLAVGLSQKHMSAIELDKVDPKLSVVKRLAKVLGVKIGQLLEEEKEIHDTKDSTTNFPE